MFIWGWWDSIWSDFFTWNYLSQPQWWHERKSQGSPKSVRHILWEPWVTFPNVSDNASNSSWNISSLDLSGGLTDHSDAASVANKTNEDVLSPHLSDGYSKPALHGWADAIKYPVRQFVYVFKSLSRVCTCVCACLTQVSPSSEWSHCGCCIRRRISFHTWDLWHTGPWTSVLKANQWGEWKWPTLCYQIGTDQTGNNYTVIPVKRWTCALTGTFAELYSRDSRDERVEMTYRWLITFKPAALLHDLHSRALSHTEWPGPFLCVFRCFEIKICTMHIRAYCRSLPRLMNIFTVIICWLFSWFLVFLD